MSKTMLFQDLDAVFKHLQDGKAYREYCKKRVARIILPNSVIRVFTAGTKLAIFDCLQKIDVDELPALKTRELFDSWHKTQLGKVSKSISGFGNNLAEIGEEGIRYGHAAKILNLFLGHLVFFSPYFSTTASEKVRHFLHVPFDKKIFVSLRSFQIKDVPNSIKSVDRTTYYRLQAQLREAAGKRSVPPLYFDDYAWTIDDRK
ncbi:MAG: hypothetical protein J0H92_19095 [Sphingobacteriales bacterium]|nr:hypothetical protein [Sphingobacteriales bacterium]